MNFCSECGVALTDKAHFCSGCGTPVSDNETADTDADTSQVAVGSETAAIRCECGRLNPGGKKHCLFCDRQLIAAMPERKGLARGAPPRRNLFIGAAVAVVVLLGGIAFAAGGGSDDGAQDYRSETEGYYEPETEGYYEQPRYTPPPTAPKQCLEWRTDYRTVPGRPSQFGQPINPSYQVPTGQTCVRYG